MYQVSHLENGLTVATAEMPHMASVREISQAVEGLGGYLNAFTSEETTCFHCRAGHEHFEDLLDVLMDMLLNSKFDPAEVAKEREVIKEEISMYLDQPQHYVHELLNATLWPGQPLGRPITGTEKSLDSLGGTRLHGYLRENYVAGTVLVVAAGNLSHRHVARGVARYARRLPLGSRPNCTAAQNGQREPQVRLFTKKTEQTQMALGIRTCSRHDKRRYALRLLNVILGENMSSRLFQVIREDRGLAYSIYSSPSFFDDTGDLVISAGLDTENLAKTLRLVLKELRRLTDSPPGPAEMRRARDYVIGQIDLSLESTESQMNWIGEQLLGYGRIFKPAEIKRRLRAVTGAEVRAVARDFFTPDRLNLALVSPLNSDKQMARLLRLWI